MVAPDTIQYASIIQILGQENTEAIAVCDPEWQVSLSYGQLQTLIDRAAIAFTSAGLKQGDAVLFVSTNSASLLIAMLAAIKCGGIAVPVNPESTEEEIAYFLEDSQAVLLVLSKAVAETLPPDSRNFSALPLCVLAEGDAIEIENASIHRSAPSSTSTYAGDACLMIYTSGTTSRPKGVPLTHGNLLASVRAFATCYQLTASDTTLVPMPYFHVHGLVGATLSTLFTGGKVVIQPRFSASNFWSQVVEHNVTWYTASPTIHRILLKRAEHDVIPRGQLRFVRSSSASLGVDTLMELEEKFATVMLEGYGMTEAANQVSCNPLPPHKRKPGSVGVAAGCEIKIADEQGRPLPDGERGEITIRGPAVMTGYHNKAETTAAAFRDGWFRTGDLGYIDSESYIYIVGRIKELIIRGGENISPAEVEEVLRRHPLVDDAACFALSDSKYGEEVGAAVVLKQASDGSDDVTSEIKLHCGKHLNAIKVPKQIYFVDNIPRTSTNKVRRDVLAAQFSGSMPEQQG